MKATCAMLPRAIGNEQQKCNKNEASLLDSTRALRVDDINVLASLMGLEAGFICSARIVHIPSSGGLVKLIPPPNTKKDTCTAVTEAQKYTWVCAAYALEISLQKA